MKNYCFFMLRLGLWCIQQAEPPWTQGSTTQLLAPGDGLGGVNNGKVLTRMRPLLIDTPGVSILRVSPEQAGSRVLVHKWAALMLSAQVGAWAPRASLRVFLSDSISNSQLSMWHCFLGIVKRGRADLRVTHRRRACKARSFRCQS